MFSGYELGKIEHGQLITDPARFPKSFKEAPALAARVRQGTLPPVAERIGRDPLVLKPVHGIGKYGGTWHRAFIRASRSGPDEEFIASGPDGLLFFDPTYTTVVANIARAFELSDDAKVLTIWLRRGMHWSDGAPFTADDVMSWYEDMYLNGDLIESPHPNLLLGDRPIVIQALDADTVRLVSPDPHPLLPSVVANRGALSGQACEIGGAQGMGLFAPKHYLAQFHPKYALGGQAAVDEMAADAESSDWASFFKARNDWTIDADLPVLTPWKVTKGKEVNTENFVLERNPYSIWVDSDGNQLPYIDRISMSAAEGPEIVNQRAAAGEYDFQANHLFAEHLDLFRANEAKGGYEVHLNPNANNVSSIRINLAYEADPVIGDLIRTADFRRALALGIDRDEINEVFFQGMAEPNTVGPSDENPYFPGAEYRTLWATTDVERANEMLDALELDQKDAEGYRLRRDGKRLCLEFTCIVTYADQPAIAGLIKQQWRQIGVDITVTRVPNAAGGELGEPANNNEIQFAVHAAGSEELFIFPDEVFPTSRAGFSGVLGPPYVRWFQTHGAEGKEPPAKMREVMELYRTGYVAPEAERIAIGKQMYRILIEEAFVIGLLRGGCGQYGMYLAKTTLGNIPARVVNATTAPLNTYPMTFYFK